MRQHTSENDLLRLNRAGKMASTVSSTIRSSSGPGKHWTTTLLNNACYTDLGTDNLPSEVYS